MNLLSDIITYVRRIIKSPSNAVITDNLIIDYINRFYLNDMDARLQLFDFKTTYEFQTTPGVDQYNMPLYTVQSETPPGVNAGTNNINSADIASFPVYQGFLGPAYVNGVNIFFQTEKQSFYNTWFNYVQPLQAVAVGNGTAGPYTINIPIVNNIAPTPNNPPYNSLLRANVDITGVIANINNGNGYTDPILVNSTQINNIGTSSDNFFIPRVPTTSVFPGITITSTDATGSNVVVQDSGQFLQSNINYGLLMQPGKAPYGNLPLTNGPAPYYSTTKNTINYQTGVISNLYFPASIPAGNNINVQCYYFQGGLPRSVLYYNNTLTLRPIPSQQFLVQLEAYLAPAAFFNQTQAIPFSYMAEYIARGAARKILSDTGDIEQLQFYEPLFREQEMLVWKRSQRQFTSTRTQTIYSQGRGQGAQGSNSQWGPL